MPLIHIMKEITFHLAASHVERVSAHPMMMPNAPRALEGVVQKYPFTLNPLMMIFSFFFLVHSLRLGLDIWRLMVSNMVGCRRVDVHSIHIKSVCHFIGSVCGRHPARHISQHYVNKTSQIANCRTLGAIVCDLFSTAGRVEGRKGKWSI